MNHANITTWMRSGNANSVEVRATTMTPRADNTIRPT